MRNFVISIALVGAGFATVAAAHDLETAFATRGDCQVALRWADYDVKRKVTKQDREPAGPTNRELHETFECQKFGNAWYIVIIGA